MMRLLLLPFFIIFFVTPSFASPYVLETEKTTMQFSGSHMGKEFNGTFNNWNADINFDAANLTGSTVHVTIDSTSVETGNTVNDATLPQADWLDSKNYPTITFKSTGFEDLSNNLYKVTGDLTLKGITKSISFDARLSDPTADAVSAKINFIIDRTDYNIGTKSDAEGEWVGRDIELTFDLYALKK